MFKSYHLKQVSVTFIIAILFIVFLCFRTIYAQISKSVECGTVLETELTTNNPQKLDTYNIEFAYGDEVTISVVPIGNGIRPQIILYDPSSKTVSYAITYDRGDSTSINNVVLGSTGLYLLTVEGLQRTFGAYTLSIGCTLRDGTVINPGETLSIETTDVDSLSTTLLDTQSSASAPTFSGTGFPGLPPVDFANAFRVSLNVSAPNDGEIPATGNNVLGFKFTANAGDKMDLSFTRISGNLNLGLVVLSSTNQVVYMAALVNSEAMTARFTLLFDGEYTIGIFSLNLLPPEVPSATSFSLHSALNS